MCHNRVIFEKMLIGFRLQLDKLVFVAMFLKCI